MVSAQCRSQSKNDQQPGSLKVPSPRVGEGWLEVMEFKTEN